MINPLAMKLEQFTRLDSDARARVDALAAGQIKRFQKRATILPEGERVHHIHLVLDGLAARTKTLPNGKRQTLAFLVPGDLCDVEVFVLAAMDHDIVAVADTTCALIPVAEMEELLTTSSSLTRALWWSTMTDSAVLRERIIDHGKRDAREKVAHLLYELFIRYRIVGQARNAIFPFPLTQEELGEATGLTPVHVNRTVQTLRSEGLIEWKSKEVTVLDAQRLKQVAGFSADYLHLDRTQAGDPEVIQRAGDLVREQRGGVQAMPNA